jgi:ABC-type sugar transport system ATPase subunit
LSGAPVVRLMGIRKSFGSTQAVANVDLEIFAGEVHALVGENGAGKSTLMRILAGLFPEYEGRIEVAGHETRITSVRQAKHLGVALVHQELSLVPELSVAENIVLGQEPSSVIPGFISRKKSQEHAAALLKEMGIAIDPKMKVAKLSVAIRQLVEIAKGLSTKPKVLILDEPTSSLTAPEIKELFRVVRRLLERGTAVVYISHKLDEIFELADRITILRDGAKVASGLKEKWNEADLICAMVGRDCSTLFPHSHAPDLKDVVLEVDGLSRPDAFQNVSFKLHQGEVLGIYGLIGAGRTELSESLFGLEPAQGGHIKIFGQSVRVKHAWDAKRLGVALVPEDRRGRGLVLIHSVAKNLTLPVLEHLSALGFVRRGRESLEVARVLKDFSITAASASIAVETLSGGNQQKVVIGKWLLRPPRILVLDEPTRGIDVGAKAEIYSLIDKLAGQGMAIIFISSELPEVMGMSDRVLVMREGDIAGEFSRDKISAERLGAAAAGVSHEAVSSGVR